MSAEIGFIRTAAIVVNDHVQNHVGVLYGAESRTIDGLNAIEAAQAHIATALKELALAHKSFEEAGDIITDSAKEHMEAANNTATAAGLESSNNETIKRVLRALGSVSTSTDDMRALMERQTGAMIPNEIPGNHATSQYAEAARADLVEFHDDCNHQGEPMKNLYSNARRIKWATKALQL